MPCRERFCLDCEDSDNHTTHTAITLFKEGGIYLWAKDRSDDVALVIQGLNVDGLFDSLIDQLKVTVGPDLPEPSPHGYEFEVKTGCFCVTPQDDIPAGKVEILVGVSGRIALTKKAIANLLKHAECIKTLLKQGLRSDDCACHAPGSITSFSPFKHESLADNMQRACVLRRESSESGRHSPHGDCFSPPEDDCPWPKKKKKKEKPNDKKGVGDGVEGGTGEETDTETETETETEAEAEAEAEAVMGTQRDEKQREQEEGKEEEEEKGDETQEEEERENPSWMRCDDVADYPETQPID